MTPVWDMEGGHGTGDGGSQAHVESMLNDAKRARGLLPDATPVGPIQSGSPDQLATQDSSTLADTAVDAEDEDRNAPNVGIATGNKSDALLPVGAMADITGEAKPSLGGTINDGISGLAFGPESGPSMTLSSNDEVLEGPTIHSFDVDHDIDFGATTDQEEKTDWDLDAQHSRGQQEGKTRVDAADLEVTEEIPKQTDPYVTRAIQGDMFYSSGSRTQHVRVDLQEEALQSAVKAAVEAGGTGTLMERIALVTKYVQEDVLYDMQSVGADAQSNKYKRMLASAYTKLETHKWWPVSKIS